VKEKQLIVKETNIKQLMKQNKIKCKQLAKHLKVNPSTITRILKDEEKLSINELTNILDFLGYTIEINIMKN
jgi:plasmid maintenance system antidote protein VapI